MADNNNNNNKPNKPKKGNDNKNKTKNSQDKNKEKVLTDDSAVIKQRINNVGVDVGNIKRTQQLLLKKIDELEREVAESRKASSMTCTKKVDPEVAKAIYQNHLPVQDKSPPVRVPTQDADTCGITSDSQVAVENLDPDEDHIVLTFAQKSVLNPLTQTIGQDRTINAGIPSDLGGVELIIPLDDLVANAPLQTQCHTSDNKYVVVPKNYSDNISTDAGFNSPTGYPVELVNPGAAHWRFKIIGAIGTSIVRVYTDGPETIDLTADISSVLVTATFFKFQVWVVDADDSQDFTGVRLILYCDLVGSSPLVFRGARYHQCMKVYRFVHHKYFTETEVTSSRVTEVAILQSWFGGTYDNAGSISACALPTPLLLDDDSPDQTFGTAMTTVAGSVKSRQISTGLFMPSYPKYSNYTRGVRMLNPFNAVDSQSGVLWSYTTINPIADAVSARPMSCSLFGIIEFKTKQPLGGIDAAGGLNHEFEVARKIALSNYAIPGNPSHVDEGKKRFVDTMYKTGSKLFHWAGDAVNSFQKTTGGTKNVTKQLNALGKLAGESFIELGMTGLDVLIAELI